MYIKILIEMPVYDLGGFLYTEKHMDITKRFTQFIDRFDFDVEYEFFDEHVEFTFYETPRNFNARNVAKRIKRIRDSWQHKYGVKF